MNLQTPPILYRKRLIPDECILLKDDRILECGRDRIVTSWMALHPKKDLHHGYSCYCLQEGIKVSKFLQEDDSLLYWYCDIVDFDYTEAENKLVVTDLLADVILYPDRSLKVVDLDELVTALDSGALSVDGLKKCLLRLDRLLNCIYDRSFNKITDRINHYQQS